MVVPSFSPPSHIVEEPLDPETGNIDLAAAILQSQMPKETKPKPEKHKKRTASPGQPKVSHRWLAIQMRDLEDPQMLKVCMKTLQVSSGKDIPSPSGSSSSSGSYSLTGSAPDLVDKKKSSEKEIDIIEPEVPATVKQPVVAQRPPIPSPTQLEQMVPVIKVCTLYSLDR